jgi:hypothetical protein
MTRPGSPPDELLETIGNLAEFHREHEKFYAQAPLGQAQDVQAASRLLKALAARWSTVDPVERPAANPFAGARDLNPPGVTAELGTLFMEGEGEPSEITRTKRDLATLAGDIGQTGEWLASAMEQSWQVAGALGAFPALADVLGERHRIIADDWQSAALQQLVAHLIRRALDLLEHVELTPAAVRADLAGERVDARYLYSASELLDRAADLMLDSAMLVHGNERRWRVFGERVAALLGG